MSDIVQGALIGISGAIVGAVITAIIAYINTKSQLNLRIYKLRTDRLIKAREKVLIPLREAITMSLEYSNKALTLTVHLVEVNRKGDKAELLREARECWKEATSKRDEARFHLAVLIERLSDSHLLQLIKEVKATQEKEKPKIIEITLLLHDLEGSISSMNVATMTRLNKELEEFHNITLSKLLPLNKRIEELLSGEPSN